MLRDRVSPGSGAGQQAWIVSSLFHAVLLALFIPLFQYLPRITPEPFRLTITLVEPFDAPSEAQSTPPKDADHLRAALTSESHSLAPARPSATVSHENESGPRRVTAVHAQASPLAKTARGTLHVPALPPSDQSMVVERPVPSESLVPMSQPVTTGLPDRDSLPAPAPALRHLPSPLAEMTRNPHPPAALAELVRPQEIAPEPSIQQASEPTRHPTSQSSDQSIRNVPVASQTPSAAEAPAALPVTQNEDESPPLVATRIPATDHGAFFTAGEPGPIRQDEPRSGQSLQESVAHTTPRADYGWLQHALFRRLEELKRSSRPFMQESGRLRVLVKAVVSSTGELVEAEIVNSSGHPRIDQEAMTLVQRVFPISLDRALERPQVVMRIPITFSRD